MDTKKKTKLYIVDKKKAKLFVSYSRHDEALIKPLASLLRLAAAEPVFLDVDSLKPGRTVGKENYRRFGGMNRRCGVLVLCGGKIEICCNRDRNSVARRSKIVGARASSLGETSRREKAALFEQIRREFEFGVGTIVGVSRKLGVHRRMVRET